MNSQKTVLLLIALAVVGFVMFSVINKAPSPEQSGGIACGSILAEDSIPTPLTCTEDIGNRAGVATLSVATDGALRVTLGDKLVFANPGAEDAGQDHMAYDGSGLKTGAFQFQDVTYDGHKDIIFLSSAGAYNFTYQYYAFNPEQGTYDSKPLLEATNPQIKADSKTILSFAKGRGAGDIYVFETYQFTDGAYVLTKREWQDNVSSDPSEGYVRVTEELQNGRMVETERKMLSEEEVRGEAS